MNAKHNAPRYLAIVPARGGSKRLPGKNLLPLGGRPLIGHTLEAARAARRLNAVVVSTDSQQIADYAQTLGVDAQGLRPAGIAGDTSPVVAALQDAYVKFSQRQPPVDAVVCCSRLHRCARRGILTRLSRCSSRAAPTR